MENREHNKFNLCVLPTQMGKTFVIVNKIMESLEQDEERGRSIHIVLTMNTLLNNRQFSNRLREVNNKYGDGSVCVFASVYKGDYTHIKQAEHILNEPEVKPKKTKGTKKAKDAEAAEATETETETKTEEKGKSGREK